MPKDQTLKKIRTLPSSECSPKTVGKQTELFREERTWAIAIFTVLREPKFRNESPYFSRGRQPEFRRERDLYEPLQTAMAQVLPFLNYEQTGVSDSMTFN